MCDAVEAGGFFQAVDHDPELSPTERKLLRRWLVEQASANVASGLFQAIGDAPGMSLSERKFLRRLLVERSVDSSRAAVPIDGQIGQYEMAMETAQLHMGEGTGVVVVCNALRTRGAAALAKQLSMA